ncbi:gluconate 2-dehydrogenase subunit 3 family protein [Niabella drilacis]|uniref:Gluconate 2-dehydrogenase subunit 3 n=1 Tax=Niabella drilacis (strain DSM 25811 / CCM 8410 / CCUG 62505 / LMG 26954 / E90) TaxID=1285928 RepID=A0A1G6WJ03_NIADE|nr:gluconate 2-dehydrogenase subunit 3 family protein [Niabella drilacis]SDD65046.1 Gluconate 2-dehydrogenase subunit 3 [Niabella drilacis]
MNRREALTQVSLLLGGALVGADAFLSGCKNPAGETGLFTAADLALLDEIGETILPATPDSGGARAARVGTFMQSVITDCYTETERKTFSEGLAQLKEACNRQYKKTFEQLSPAEKAGFLTGLYNEARAYVNTDAYKKAKDQFNQQQDEKTRAAAAGNDFGASYLKENYPPHYFTMMRQLTLWGYFSSEVGMTKALRYVETPGHYNGAYPYKKGDKAWAL